MTRVYVELDIQSLEEVDYLRSVLSIYDIVSITDVNGKEVEEDDVYS